VTSEAAEEAAAAPVEDAPAPEELKKAEWDTKLNIGLNLAAGNTEQLGAATTIVSTRTTDATALTLDAGYFYASQDGEKTANRFTSGVNNDWLMPDSRWLLFAGGRYDWDEFRSFDHRISANGGAGYELIKRDTMQLTLRAGAGFFQEYGSGRNEIVPEGLLGADFNWEIADNQSFQVSTRIFPDLSDGGEFRTFTTAGWKLDIDKADGLSFSINAIHEYISSVDPGIEKTDLQLFAGLTYDF
jgi:putative salt-induced outer membrane protein YdiY